MRSCPWVGPGCAQGVGTGDHTGDSVTIIKRLSPFPLFESSAITAHIAAVVRTSVCVVSWRGGEVKVEFNSLSVADFIPLKRILVTGEEEEEVLFTLPSSLASG